MQATRSLQDEEIIYDCNRLNAPVSTRRRPVELFDETLRDGCQSPSVKDPSLEDKLALLHRMDELGIAWCDVGMASNGAGRRAEIARLLQEIDRSRLRLRPVIIARTVIDPDITAAAELVQRTGVPARVYLFIGSSPIRRWAEGWDLDFVLRQTVESIAFAVKEGLDVGYATEDTTRTDPDTVAALFGAAVEAGASAVALCDTVGHATPEGLSALYRFVKDVLRGAGAAHVSVDWHGHNDRGLALALSLLAVDLGFDVVHGCALGIGERVGNAPLDQIILNLKLRGEWPHPVAGLVDYVRLAARATGVPIPDTYPLAGRDAFRTATGVHAAAIVKAMRKGDAALADRIYAGVPAGDFGREQEIEIGVMSGLSNVTYWLERRGLDADPGLARFLLEEAKRSSEILTEAEVWASVRRWEATHGRSIPDLRFAG